MPRRLREASGNVVYHVLNRGAGRMTLFRKPRDFEAFEQVLLEAWQRSGIRILAYTLMPNHWHLVLWPREDDELSEVMRWLTVTHTQRWHAHHHTAGTGPVYQGRFKSFPVQSDEHFLTVARYVERNAARAKLVSRAEDWRWSSLWASQHADALSSQFLARWPVPRPGDWLRRVNLALSAAELTALRTSVTRGRPYGSDRWVGRTAERMGLESTLRPRGRPAIHPANNATKQ